MQRTPYPKSGRDTFRVFSQHFFAICLLLQSLTILLFTTFYVVHDKEARLKEYMHVMGLRSWEFWLTHLITSLVKITVIALTTSLILALLPPSTGTLVCDFGILFVFFFLGGLATVATAFAVAAFFSSSKPAALLAAVFALLSFSPDFFLQAGFDSMPVVYKAAAALLPNTAISFAARRLGQAEKGAPMTWARLWDCESSTGTLVEYRTELCLGWIFVILFVSSLLLFALTAYGEGLMGPNGNIARLPWYPCQASYWWADEDEWEGEEGPAEEADPALFEGDPEGASPSVHIRGLVKRFGAGPSAVTALKDLNAKFYPAQVTALLGHNGAGKSTTVSIITGLEKQTEGVVSILGLDTRTHIQEIQSILGVCPQYDALFGMLTAPQHLYFFASLKEVWRLIQAEKTRRTILLTTHHMDEADLLADRILILKAGKLQCGGSPLFLKSAFGSGYKVTVRFALDELVSPTGPSANIPMGRDERCTSVLGLTRDVVPSVDDVRLGGRELSFSLPSSASADFPKLFAELEANQIRLGVESLGVSVTTMEDVFLKTGQAPKPAAAPVEFNVTQENGVEMKTVSGTRDRQRTSTIDETNSTRSFVKDANRVDGCSKYRLQFVGLLIKRLTLVRHNLLLFCSQMLLTPLLLGSAKLVNLAVLGPVVQPALDLGLGGYTNSTLPFRLDSCDDNITQSFHRRLQGTAATAMPANQTLPYNDSVSSWVLDQYRRLPLKIGPQNTEIGLAINCADKTATAYFNNQGYHNIATALHFMLSTLLDINLTVVNHPLPPTDSDSHFNMALSSTKTFVITIFMTFGMCFLAASFSYVPIRERVLGVAHLQALSGLHPVLYWLSNLTFDLACFTLANGLISLLIKVFSVNMLSLDSGPAGMLCLLCAFAWASLPGAYGLGRGFRSGGSGFVGVALLFFTPAALSLILTNFFLVVGEKERHHKLDDVAIALFPGYALASGLSFHIPSHPQTIVAQLYRDYSMNKMKHEYCHNNEDMLKDIRTIGRIDPCDQDGLLKNCCVNDPPGYVSWSLSWTRGGIGRHLFFLVLQGILNWAIFALLESGLLQAWLAQAKGRLSALSDRRSVRTQTRPSPSSNARLQCKMSMSMVAGLELVVAEAEAVAEIGEEEALQTPLLLRGLSKSFGPHRAVKELTFRLQAGQCFGLLGVNGAGKTSTFKMLTGQIPISGGSAEISGLSVEHSWRKAAESVGYCPQFDALLGEMTGKETLNLYARLAGYPQKIVSNIVEEIMMDVGISQYGNRQCGSYSGGNKRRLSLGIAMMGNPQLLLLDEPSSGVDPGAKRGVWKILNTIRERGTALLLTSHSMEECEALCSRLGVMVAGELKTIGTSQELKVLHGKSYRLCLKLASPDRRMAAYERLSTLLPGAILIDVQQGQMLWEIPKSSQVSWSGLFGILELERARLSIVDYSLSQTTLEQIFLALTAEHKQ